MGLPQMPGGPNWMNTSPGGLGTASLIPSMGNNPDPFSGNSPFAPPGSLDSINNNPDDSKKKGNEFSYGGKYR